MIRQPAFTVPCQLDLRSGFSCPTDRFPSCNLNSNSKAVRRTPCMSVSRPCVSRRRMGKLMLSAIAASLAIDLDNVSSVQAAEKPAKKPEFIKDESGILYYDVTVGNGASPIEGDFVIIDYVRCLFPQLTSDILGIKRTAIC